MISTVDDIIRMFTLKGHSMYGNEPVSQADHALQCASLAVTSKASDALVSAALLHDIGHLLHDLPDESADHGIDDFHENLAYQYLTQRFIPEVAEPVRLHVEAKRYLCAVKSGYLEALSPASVQSLKLQGGVMSKEECEVFEKNPWSEAAVTLRQWDDEAKIPNLQVPGIATYTMILKSCLL